MSVLNKSKAFIAVGFLGVFLSASVFFINRGETEPHYAGEPLSFWLPQLSKTSLPVEKVMQARAAVDSIGTNHPELLLSWAREPRSKKAPSTYQEFRNWLGHRPGFSLVQEPFQLSHPEMAWWVFTSAPKVSKAASEGLISLCDAPDPFTGNRAIESLDVAMSDFGTEDIPRLMPLLSHTNPRVRSLATLTLARITLQGSVSD